METGKVIFVEDNIHDAELIRLSFKETNFRGELIRFDSGFSFLEFLATHEPSNILFVMLDVDMPRMTGLQTMELLNKKGLKKFPVVFFTASRDKESVRQAKLLNADAFVTKPIDFDKFQQSIEDIWRFYGELNEFSRIRPLIRI